jgi:hypothetical protein
MKTTFFSLLVIIILSPSCKNSSQITTNLPYHINLEKSINNEKPLPLSSIGKKIEYIPLETNPECLIKRVSNISVTDSFIVVSDNNLGLLLFSIKGKYLRKIGNIGRGPDEYPNVNDFIVDNNQKEIYVLSTREVNVYDFNGQFKRDFKLDFPCEQIIMDENDDLIIHRYNSAQPTTNPVYSWYIYDKSGIVLQKIENTLKRVNGGVTVPMSPLYVYNGTTHFMEFGIDTLYNYSRNEKIPYAVFNLGKMKHPVDPTLSESLKNKNWIWISYIRETKDLLLISVWKGSRTILKCVYNKTTSAFAVLNENGFTNDIDDGINFWPIMITNDNLMIDYIDAFDLITYTKNNQANNKKQSIRLKEIADQLSETSNPVIIIVK